MIDKAKKFISKLWNDESSTGEKLERNKCLIDGFFEEEFKKPEDQRKSYCMIYCSCSKCKKDRRL